MAQHSFQCKVISPEQEVLSVEAASAVFPAYDGEIGILVGRAPLICSLGIGIMRITTTGGDEKRVMVDEGFAQMLNNELTLLTDRARLPENENPQEARRALETATAMPIAHAQALEARDKAIRRAKARLKLINAA